MVIIKNMDIDVWSTFDLGILVPVLKRWEHQTSLPVSWKTCMHVKKQQLKPYVEQLTGSVVGKEYVKVVYCHSVYLALCRVHHVRCQAGCIISWNQDCQKKYQPQICRWYHSDSRKWRGTEEPLDESEREWKSWLKTQHSKNGDHGISPITSWQIEGKK